MNEDNLETMLDHLWEVLQDQIEMIPSNLDKTIIIEELIERLIDFADQFTDDEDFDDVELEEVEE